MKTITVFVLLITMSVSGCASIMHGGGHQTVGIATNPVGATVTIEGQKYTSPARVELDRKQNYTGLVELEGHDTASFTVTKKISGWIWGNLAFGGVLGLVIDLAVGGAYSLSPENITIDMKRQFVPAQMQTAAALTEVAQTPVDISAAPPSVPEGLVFRVGENPNPPKDARDRS